MDNYEIVLALLLGIFICFFGYRLKKIAFFVAWFLVGYTLLRQFMPWIIDNVPFVANSNLWQGLFPVLGGLLLSLVGFSIEKLCLALLCVAVAIWFGIHQFGNGIPVVAISAIVGVIVGAISVRVIKPATILITAIAGAAVVADAITKLVTEIPREPYELIILAGVALLSTIFQFINTKNLE